ncbi:aminodeoxychorismate lyase [Shewanella sp. ENK2]|uniref:aminodeoxychorismate lyase n=1 Tax=Shewanella sp. ENK2 TaxID=2775245 RepID=UPI00374A7A1C
MALVFVNGQSENTIQALDRGLAYGDGVFATMRVSNSQVMFIEAHLSRLNQACLRLGFQPPVLSDLQSRLQKHAQSLGEGCIKLLISRGVGGRGYTAPSNPTITEVISLHEIPKHYQGWQQQGISLSVSLVQLAKQPLLAGMKHLNRLEQVLIKQYELTAKADDWLILDTDNHVVETSMANIFLVKGNQVITPKLSDSGVAGVMREQVINTLLDNHFAVMATKVTMDDIKNADHVFITNSLLGMVNINSIIDRQVNASLSSTTHYKPWQYTTPLLTQLTLSL